MSQKAAKILSQTVELLECFLMMFMFVIIPVCCPQLAAVQETQKCYILNISKLTLQPFRLLTLALYKGTFFMLLMLEGRKGTTLTVFLLGLCKPLSGVINHSG